MHLKVIIMIIELNNTTECVAFHTYSFERNVLSLEWNVYQNSRTTNFQIIYENSNFPNVISSNFNFELLK